MTQRPADRSGTVATPGRPAVTVAVLVLAVVVRAWAWFWPHGFFGVLEYDDGVYYGAARFLVHGLFPYRDFALLHPPLSMLLLAPFAALGAAFGDPAGMAAARVAVLAITVVNVLLVRRIASSLWPGRGSAGTVAALAFALSPTAVVAGHTVLLEPLVDVCCLSAVVLLMRSLSVAAQGRLVGAGALLGLALTVKLFAGFYVVAILLWVVGLRRWRWLLAIVTGLVVTAGVVVAPFAVGAPRAFWTDVVSSQLTRPADERMSVLGRLAAVTGLDAVPGPAALVVLLVVGAGIAMARRRLDRAEMLVALCLVVTVAGFVAAPSYFLHYGAVCAPLLALAAGRAWTSVPSRWPAAVIAGVGVAAVLVVYAVGTGVVLSRWHGQPDVQAATRGMPTSSCVYADEASLLIAADVFRPPSPSCRSWLDPRGMALLLPPRGRAAAYLPGRIPVGARWQRAVARQVESADVLLLHADPTTMPQWPPGLRSYVAEHFTRSWTSPPGLRHAELWRRTSAQPG